MSTIAETVYCRNCHNAIDFDKEATNISTTRYPSTGPKYHHTICPPTTSRFAPIGPTSKELMEALQKPFNLPANEYPWKPSTHKTPNPILPSSTKVRTFETGATRDVDDTKYDYEGFLSPIVIERFGKYMHKNRFQKDGSVRDSCNWQKGIPLSAYMKSGWRHFLDWWKFHRGWGGLDIEDTLCAVIFNAAGYLHETLKVERSKSEVSSN